MPVHRPSALALLLALAACQAHTGSTLGARRDPPTLAIPRPRLESEAGCVAAASTPRPCADVPAVDRAAPLDAVLHGIIDADGVGDFCRSLRLSENAVERSPNPALRLALARAQLEVGLLARALASAEQCVDDANRDPAPTPRRELLRRECRVVVAAARLRVGRVVVRTPTAVRVHLDGEWRDAPAGETTFVAATGEQRLAVYAREALCCERQLTLDATHAVEFDLERQHGEHDCHVAVVLP